jgi:hypothetical protein
MILYLFDKEIRQRQSTPHKIAKIGTKVSQTLRCPDSQLSSRQTQNLIRVKTELFQHGESRVNNR